MHQELKSNRSVTLQLLWEEYKEGQPDGVNYSWFCDQYRDWARHLDVVLRQDHRAGEKMFVDWAGDTIPIYQRSSDQVGAASLFVSVLGFSSYTYAEVTANEQMEAWLGAHMHALEYYGGAPR